MFFEDRVVKFNEIFVESRKTGNIFSIFRMKKHYGLKTILVLTVIVFFGILLLLLGNLSNIYISNLYAPYIASLVDFLVLTVIIEIANRRDFFELHKIQGYPKEVLSYEEKKYFRTKEAVSKMSLSSGEVQKLVEWYGVGKGILDLSLAKPASLYLTSLLSPLFLAYIQNGSSDLLGVFFFLFWAGLVTFFLHAAASSGLRSDEKSRQKKIDFLQRFQIETRLV